jgi:hypothetical protein
MDTLPANRKIEMLSTRGQGRVLEDNDAAIDAALRGMPDDAPLVRRGRGASGLPEPPRESATHTYDNDCAVGAPGGRGTGRAAIALGLAAVLAARRRFRQRRARE